MTRNWKPLICVVAAAVLWAATTQLGLVLPNLDCARQSVWTVVSVAVVELALIAIVSFVSVGANKVSSRRDIFLAVGATGIFMFAIMPQGAASVLLNACEH